MTYSSIDPRIDATVVVASGGIAARQFEAYLARQHVLEGHNAWLAPVVQTRQAWATELWARHLDDGRRQLLTSGQADALWRRVIDESDDGHGLLGYRHGPALARAASQRLRDWNIDSAALRSFGDDADCRAFFRWEEAFRSALIESDWFDPADVETALGANARSIFPEPGVAVVLGDMTLTPVQVRLSQGLQESGHRIATWQPPRVNRDCVRVHFPDASAEVRAAAEWAAGKLAQDSGLRVAIVVSGMDSRRGEVERVFDDVLHPGRLRLGVEDALPIVNLGGRMPALDSPLIGAALTALELFTSRGAFPVISRWLRSPFFVFGTGDVEARCQLEVQLRSHIASQLEFVEAFRSGGLQARIRAEIPALADALATGVELMDAQPGQATPTHWSGVWRRLLSLLGWQGNVTDTTAFEEWEAGLNELALLTPILGKLRCSDALTELERLLGRPRRLGPISLEGIFLLEDPEDVGPGYDALWVSGLTDAVWPRAAQPIPLLPLELQRSQGMPMSFPSDTLEHSRLLLRRAIDRVPDVVLSSPGIVHDYPAQPSPLIVAYPEVPISNLVQSPIKGVRQPVACPDRIEIRQDPVPAVSRRRLRGGVRTLSLHSVCPLRAFIESRLQARPLEPVRSGLSVRQRGIVTHASLQRLFRELPAQDDLSSWDAGERSRRIDTCIDEPLRELFGPAADSLRAVVDLEATRLRPILARLLELELTRSGFQVQAVEMQAEFSVGGMDLICRIDRIDRLDPEGSLAVIDYKTGAPNPPSDWLKERPRNLQLPLYALAAEGDIRALVICSLHPRNLGYKGIWTAPELFPGRSTRLPHERTWSLQLSRWHEQLELLIGEFARGDGRIFKAELNAAGGAFAPLTRVHELVARQRRPS